jgi:hypothetical protein
MDDLVTRLRGTVDYSIYTDSRSVHYDIPKVQVRKKKVKGPQILMVGLRQRTTLANEPSYNEWIGHSQSCSFR